MSKSSKSNSSGKKKKPNKLKTKNNGNVREGKEELTEELGDTDLSARLVLGKISDSDSRDNEASLPESKPDKIKNITDDKSIITEAHSQDSVAATDILNVDKDSSVHNDSSIVHVSALESSNAVTSPSVKGSANSLFNSIHNGEIALTLPNRAWSVHCTNTPQKSIIVSEAVIRYNSETGLVPTYTKQIIFDEKMNYELFLLNSKGVKPKSHTVDTIADVMNIITYTNNLKLCKGGPEVIVYCNINPECAYRDYNERWRHNLCTLEVSENDTCESCFSLEEILRRHIQRSKQAVKSKAFVGYGKRKRVCQ